MSHLLPRVFSRIGERFDKHYLLFIRVGLSVCIWFSVFAHAAHDLWTACLVFATLTFFVLVLIVGHGRTKREILLPFIGPILLFLGALAISTHYSYDFPSSRLECWMWLFSFVGFYLLLNCSRTVDQLDSFYELSSCVLIPLFLVYLGERAAGAQAYYSTLMNASVVSGFTLFWGVFIWDRKSQQIFRVMTLLALIGLLILAQSWSAFASLLIGLMYYYKEDIKIIENKRVILISLLFLFTVFAILFKLSSHSDLYLHKYNSAVDRLTWWRLALIMFRQHPWAGVGLGAYGTVYRFFKAGSSMNTIFAHSFPLQLLSESGFLGTLSFLWILARMAPRIRSAKRRVFLATVITVACYSFLNINMEYFLNKLMLLFVAAVLVTESKSDFRIQNRNGLAFVALVMVLLIPSWIRPWQSSISLEGGAQNEQRGDWVRARTSYEKALDLDRSNADAYAGLARTYRQAYQESHSSADLAEWRSDMIWALRYKKDVHFIMELERTSP